MKKWIVTYTLDKEHFSVEGVDGTTYTNAYINTMVIHPDAIITDIKEA